VFMGWRHMVVIIEAAQAIYAEVKNLCVWVKAFARSTEEGDLLAMHRTVKPVRLVQVQSWM
jgi:hypothetical protein